MWTATQGKARRRLRLIAEPSREVGARSMFVPLELRLPEDMVRTSHGANFTVAHELTIALDMPSAKSPTARIPITVV